MLTIRERILQEIQARTGAQRELEEFDERELPFTVLLAGEDEEDGAIYDTTPLTMQIAVARAFAPTGDKGDSWHEQAETAYGDLVTEVMGSDRSLGGLATRLLHTGGAAGTIENTASAVSAQAIFRVHYRIATGDPFSIDPALQE